MPVRHRDGKVKQQQRLAHQRKQARVMPQLVELSNPILWAALLFVAIGIWRIVLTLRNPDAGGMGRRYRHKQRARTRTQEDKEN